ncbi:short chain dehydrogenase reductase [Grosmannia clavigera kw1407]|uniref:Short chain dehydrogenase reductase n=1 Tax=Grosmannia clavigera (strain kw1407 / UAMH 11150) TaxID=655863 RepID=F0X9G6_GROCL|nr:short chain dehydrogenase reductase [Grosmannia clavigera kw1407]EFX05790.1 short chain dehydrogenase reductase [Grosmannia clavigera kw1407]
MSTKTVVLVTGANQGIGFEIVKKLATDQKDYQIIAAGRRKSAIEEAVEKLHAVGLSSVSSLVLDVVSDESIASAVKEIESRYGRLDVLVNNAGISGDSSNSRADWKAVFDTNVAGVAAVTDACIPLMEKSVEADRPKRIVFVSSTLGSISLKADPKAQTHANLARTYTTSKAALNMLAWHYMVTYENDKNWKINCCCPGFCATNLNSYRGFDTPEQGAIRPSELATLGPDGPTATYSNRHGLVPW